MTISDTLKSVRIVTADELEVNGGRFKLRQGPAIKVRGYTTSNIGSRMVKGGDAQPVYVLSDTDIRSAGGRWRVNAGQAIQVTDVIGDARGIIQGAAIPVFPVDDDGNYDPNFAGFLPTQIAGLVIWLDANQIAGIADGNPVTTWIDQSGNGYDVTQGVAANRPLYETNEINGLPIVFFDGVDDFLQNNAFFDFGDQYTVFIVGAYRITPDAANAMFEVSTGVVNTGFLQGFLGGLSVTFRCVDSVGNKDIVDPADIRDAIYRIHTMTSNGAAGTQFWLNAISIGISPYVPPNPNITNQIDVGLLNAANFEGHVNIAELFMYDSYLSDADRQIVEAYLSNKYAIAI